VRRSISFINWFYHSGKDLRPDHLDIVGDLCNLAWLYESVRKYAHAEPHYRRALAIRGKASPNDLSLAALMSNLGEPHSNQGCYAEAEILFPRVLAIHGKVLGKWHPGW